MTRGRWTMQLLPNGRAVAGVAVVLGLAQAAPVWSQPPPGPPRPERTIDVGQIATPAMAADEPGLEELLLKASVNGKYRMLLEQTKRPEDAAAFGAFRDL